MSNEISPAQCAKDAMEYDELRQEKYRLLVHMGIVGDWLNTHSADETGWMEKFQERAALRDEYVKVVNRMMDLIKINANLPIY